MRTKTQPSRKQKRAERYRRFIQKKNEAQLYRLDARARLVEREAKQ